MKNFIDFLKLPPTILSAITIVSGCILFLPNSVLTKMGLDDLGSPYNIIVGVAFLLSSALLLVYVIKSIAAQLSKTYYNSKFKKMFPDVMQKLSLEEKAIIYALYHTPTLTGDLPMNDGLTIRLESKLVIQKIGTTFLVSHTFEIPFTLTPATVNYLEQNPNYFDTLPKQYRFDITQSDDEFDIERW